MNLLFLLAAIACLFAWHLWLKTQAHATGRIGSAQGEPELDLGDEAHPHAASAWGSEPGDKTFVTDVAWLIFCAPIAVGLMLLGAVALRFWSMSGGPAWSFNLFWPWCALIVAGVGYHGWSRAQRP